MFAVGMVISHSDSTESCEAELECREFVSLSVTFFPGSELKLSFWPSSGSRLVISSTQITTRTRFSYIFSAILFVTELPLSENFLLLLKAFVAGRGRSCHLVPR